MRRTIHVEELLNVVNDYLKESTGDPKIRLGMSVILENILFQTDNYAGYGYLPSAGVKNSGMSDVSFEDETRRIYYKHRHLAKK